MTRLLGVIVHNWPLKLAAIGLATLLYGGLVLSQSTQTFSGVIPVEQRNLPDDAFLLTTLEPVVEVRYFSPSGVPPLASTFQAWVDLGSVPVGGGPVTVPIQMSAIDKRITVVGYSPDVQTVEVDRVVVVQVPVEVQYPPPPAGLGVGATTVEPSTVSVSGPASIVARVTSARADVVIQPSGISVDQDVPLIPVDASGSPVSPVNLTPASARVSIPVFQDLRSKTLPVTPVITGSPAAGFEIASVTVEPSVVTVEGDADQLAELESIDTAPISVNGLSSERTSEVELAVPNGVVPLDRATVSVTITVRPVTATRTFEVGLELTGADPTLRYALDVDRVLITVGGSTADLDRLTGATLVGTLDVTGLTAGTHPVVVTADLPAGVTLVSASPAEVGVTITGPAAAASPGPSGSLPATSPSPAAPAETGG